MADSPMAFAGDHENKQTPEDGSGGGAPTSRKGCRCKKNECLKRYCDCFAAGAYCTSPACSCQGCHNRPEHQEKVGIARAKAKSQNPLAFLPKIVVEDSRKRHKRGCNCRSSKCGKKYCECYAAGVECCDECRCDECDNVDKNTAAAASFDSGGSGGVEDIMDNTLLLTTSVDNSSRVRLGGDRYFPATNYIAPPSVFEPQFDIPWHLSGNIGGHVAALAQPIMPLQSVAPQNGGHLGGHTVHRKHHVYQEQKPNLANQPEAPPATATQQQQQQQHQAVVNPESNADMFGPQNDIVAADTEYADMFGNQMIYSTFFGSCGCGNPYHHHHH